MKAKMFALIVLAVALPFLLASMAFGQDYPGATWIPAASANYGVANRTASNVRWVIIHTTEGTTASAVQRFQDPTQGVSAHYIISHDGSIIQMVSNKDIAYAAGNYAYNLQSINIEHERYGANNWTEAQFIASVNLVKWLAQRYNFAIVFPSEIQPANPANGTGIIGHIQVPDPNNPTLGGGASHHTDPVNWDWAHYQALFSSALPDLTIIEPVVVSPTSVAPGGTIRVDWTEKNQGTAASTPAHNTKIYLSTSAYGTTYQIGYYGPMNTLGVGATAFYYDANIVVPALIPAGDYYVTVFIDSDQQVSESNENNNIGSSSPTRVTIGTTSYTITASAGSGGSISPNGSFPKNAGDSQTFTASPNANYVVNQWLVDSGVVQNGGTGYTLNNIQAAHSVQVTFTFVPPQYTINASAGSGGSISPSGSFTKNAGDSQAFTATPNANYVVNQWLVDSSMVQNGGTGYTLNNIQAAHSVQVTFTHASSPMISNPKLTGTTFTLFVPTQVGFNYTLEYKNSVTDANWTTVQTIGGTGGAITLTDTGAIGPRRFYQVRVQ